MAFSGLQIEANEFIPRGSWCCFCGPHLIGVITKDRRDFLKKFGLQVELPPRTTRLVLDPDEYQALLLETKEASR